MRHLLLTALGLLASYTAAAQSPVGAPASQWGWGIRVGLGQATSQHGNTRREYNETSASPVIGIMATRYFAGPLVSLGAEALLTTSSLVVDFRQSATAGSVYQPQTLHQGRLFMPFYVRTSSPARGLHLLAGAGPDFALGRPGDDAAYYVRPVSLTGLAGLEVRVLPWHRYETTLGIRLQVPLTPSYAYGAPDSYVGPGGATVTHEARKDVYSRWLGFTLSTTLYPAAAR
ncbi:hypothetical protein GCM10027594_29210 [Hymenobacter agri]